MQNNANKKILIAIDEDILNDLVEQILLCDNWNYEDIDKVFPVKWSDEDIGNLLDELIDSGIWIDFLHSEVRSIIEEKFSYLWNKKS